MNINYVEKNLNSKINKAQFESNKTGHNYCVIRKGNSYKVEKYSDQKYYVYLSY